MSLWDDVIETPQNRRRNRRRKAARLAAARKILTEDESWNDAIKKEARRQSRYLRERTEKKLRERVNEAKRKGLPQPDWDGPRAADGTPLVKPAVLFKRQAARQRKLDEIRERALQAEAADERIREAERKDRKERKKRRVQPGDYDVVVRQVRRKKGVVKIDFETLGEASHRPRKGPYTDPPYTGLSQAELRKETRRQFQMLADSRAPAAPVSRQSRMRRFVLERSEDLTGTSGTGIVAEGVVFSNGHVAYTWLSPLATVTTCQSIDVVERLHGHEGRARVRFLEDA
jgi:hypothetical protein